MSLLILAYLGGVFTILSPCILPVLPFVLARADRPFRRNGLPLLLGMALVFSAVASLAAVGGGWAVAANSYGRAAALVLLGFFALMLMLPRLADRLAAPLVALGARWSASTSADLEGRRGFAAALLLGAATGLLWAPCAGPVLGLVLTGATLHGPNLGTSLLLLAYAAGAATSLAVAMLASGRALGWLKAVLGPGQWLRRGMGVAVLAGVTLIATGMDQGLLSRLSLGGTTAIEQGFVDRLLPMSQARAQEAVALSPTRFRAGSEGRMPALDGAVGWLNSPALSREELRGKVVLVDFWTYSCINCLRTLPYVRAWAEKYREAGLVVVGVHSPEFAFEKDPAHVRRAVKDLQIDYPVAIDSQHAIWRAFGNQYWPALYFVDAQGQVRHHIFGEGRYNEAERVIQGLLAESGRGGHSAGIDGLVAVQGTGTQAAPGGEVGSGERYLGYTRTGGFVAATSLAPDRSENYQPAAALRLNQWTLGGQWTVGAEEARADRAGARLAYRFSARDLHLVMGRDEAGKPVRFRLLVDGKPPGSAHGSDVDAQGYGTLDAYKLYQLVRQSSSAGEHLFEIAFFDAGAKVYAFTFG